MWLESRFCSFFQIMYLSHNLSPSWKDARKIRQNTRPDITGLEFSIIDTHCQLDNLKWLRANSQATTRQVQRKKDRRIPYYRSRKDLVAHIKEVKILHVRRAANACVDALAGLAASLFILEGELLYIMVTRRRLLTPLPKALPDPKREGVCSVKVATELIEDWQLVDTIHGFSWTWQASWPL